MFPGAEATGLAQTKPIGLKTGKRGEGGSDRPRGDTDRCEGDADRPRGGSDRCEGGSDRSEGDTDRPEGGGYMVEVSSVRVQVRQQHVIQREVIMSEESGRHYDMGEELGRAGDSLSVARIMGEVVIGGMSVAFWEGKTAAGEAMEALDEDSDDDSESAAGLVRLLSTDLDGLTRSVRRIAIERFKRSDGVLTRQFRKVATSAYSVRGIIARAEDVDRAWGNAPDAATWEPVPGLTRAAFQAKIAALKAAEGDAKDKEQTALKVSDNADKLAADLHADTVSYRIQGLATFPRGSAEWNQFDSLPTTTEGRKQTAEGEGEPAGGGDPAPPPS